MICGSRDSLPLNLQDLWLDDNDPDWMRDHHTDINIQTNYWMADRTGLAPCFDALTDYRDWSPEHGPLDAKGITYAQELVWALLGHYRTDYADTIAALCEKLYLPQVSPTTGRLEEWMSPDNLGDPTHRHLSPLVGLFPGDRIRSDGSTPAAVVAGATALLTARGMESFGPRPRAGRLRGRPALARRETDRGPHPQRRRPSTTIAYGGVSRTVTLRPGASATLKDFTR